MGAFILSKLALNARNARKSLDYLAEIVDKSSPTH
jgi:hypothetical protein